MRIPGKHGQTILHVAAGQNRAGLCRWLLSLGADVDRTDILGRTALHHAASSDAAEAARLLIERGANLTAADWKGRTPLELAENGKGRTAEQVIREEISLRAGNRVKAVKVRRDQAGRE